jgi:hypothetical protein
MTAFDALKNPAPGLDHAAHLRPANRSHTATSRI